MKPMKWWMLAGFLAAAFTLKAQTNMELTPRQQSLVEIAALEAKGDMERLEKAIHGGLENAGNEWLEPVGDEVYDKLK